MSNIIIIDGNMNRESLVSSEIIHLLKHQLDESYHEILLYNVADIDAPMYDPASYGEIHVSVKKLVQNLTVADAVIFMTPEYNGSITGALKNLLDHIPVPTLLSTPVGLVSTAGRVTGGHDAIRHLRDILRSFHARTLTKHVVAHTHEVFYENKKGNISPTLVDAFKKMVLDLNLEIQIKDTLHKIRSLEVHDV